MTHVEFEEVESNGNSTSGSSRSRSVLGNIQKARMVRALQEMGIVENEKQGYWLLFGIIVTLFVASAIILAVDVFGVSFNFWTQQPLHLPMHQHRAALAPVTR